MPNEVAQREQLGRIARCATDAGHDPAAPPETQRLAVGHVGVLKGEQRASSPGGAIVHRSPPIAGTLERRLLLRIDAAA